MKHWKTGLKTLLIYLILSIFTWSIVELFTKNVSSVLLVITSILSIIIWHEGIKRGMDQSIREGIVTALYFIIPYGVCILFGYNFLFNDGFPSPITGLLHHYLNYPMSILQMPSDVVENTQFFIFEPFLIITVLIIENLIIKVLKYKNRKIKNTNEQSAS